VSHHSRPNLVPEHDLPNAIAWIDLLGSLHHCPAPSQAACLRILKHRSLTWTAWSFLGLPSLSIAWCHRRAAITAESGLRGWQDTWCCPGLFRLPRSREMRYSSALLMDSSDHRTILLRRDLLSTTDVRQAIADAMPVYSCGPATVLGENLRAGRLQQLTQTASIWFCAQSRLFRSPLAVRLAII